MKILKKMVLPALLCFGISAMIVSCKDENVEKANSEETIKDFSASKRLAAVMDRTDLSDQDIDKYVTEYQNLSFDELINLRKLQHEKIITEMGNKTEIVASLKKDLEWFTNVNKESMGLFKKPLNQISGLQMDQIASIEDAKNSKSAKVAACPVRSFPIGFSSSGSFTISRSVVSNLDVAQPSNPNDCDCQLGFATTSTSFNRLRGTSALARSLIAVFGGTLGGRRVTTGASAGTFLIFGRFRVNALYPDAIIFGCSVINDQYRITN